MPAAPGPLPRAPGQVDASRSGTVIAVAVVIMLGVLVLLFSPRTEPLRERGRLILVHAFDLDREAREARERAERTARRRAELEAKRRAEPQAPRTGSADASGRKIVPAPPGPQARAPESAEIKPDPYARPREFFHGSWGNTQPRAREGWTSRIELSGAADGRLLVAEVWVACGKRECRAGQFPVQAVPHRTVPGQVAFLRITRSGQGRQWTLLVRASPAHPNDVETWEWHGPPGTDRRDESVVGKMRRAGAGGGSA
jgi:hypothetical protein